ncbi:unnamed protein product [Effrenium voratum]|nr:unnamed protein product [Effrenium voratum]
MAPPRLIRPDAVPPTPTQEQVDRYLALLSCERSEVLKDANFASAASSTLASGDKSSDLSAAVLKALAEIPSQLEAD